jgi:hypothetical protein
MNTLQMGWRGYAARILAADRLTRIKRWAALALAASFFLPLYSCTAKTAREPAAVQATGSTAVTPPAPPRHVEFTPAESYSMPSWEGGLVVLVFAWPLLLQGAAVLVRAARGSRVLARAARRLQTRAGRRGRALAWIEVLLCAGSAAGIGWALWFGSHMTGFAPEAGALLSTGALAAYVGAAIGGLRAARRATGGAGHGSLRSP